MRTVLLWVPVVAACYTPIDPAESGDPWGSGDGDTDADGDGDGDGDSESEDNGTSEGDGDGDGDGPAGQLRPAADAVLLADPWLDGFDRWNLPLVVTRDVGPSATCTLQIAGATGGADVGPVPVEAGFCDLSWDGRIGGEVPDPGRLQVRAMLNDAGAFAEATFEIEVVRLGIRELVAESGPARVDLLYPALGGQPNRYWSAPSDRPFWSLGPDASEPDGAVSLERADGSPRPRPQPWDDVDTPPVDSSDPDGVEDDTYSLPVALVAGAPLGLAATLSADVAGNPGGGAPSLASVRLVAPDGGSIEGDATFVPDGPVSVALSQPALAVGRYDRDLHWRFEFQGPDGNWIPVPGHVSTEVRFYGVVGPHTLGQSGLPHLPWVEVVDDVATWVGGASADPVEVGQAIADAVFNDMGLVYSASGSPAYTWFNDFERFQNAEFQLYAFLNRSQGSTINCSDAGSIVSTYGNMVGIDLRYQKIVQDFPLHYILPIGRPSFTDDPFNDGGLGFSFHAVIADADLNIWDATLALDGDGNPGSAPHSPLVAVAMPPASHGSTLSPGRISRIQGGKARITGGGTRVVRGDTVAGGPPAPELLVDVVELESPQAAAAHLDAWVGNVSRRLSPTQTPQGWVAASAGFRVELRDQTVVVVRRVSGTADLEAASRKVWSDLQLTDK